MNRRTLAAMVVIAVMSIGFFQGQTTDAQPKDSPIVGSWRRLSGESGVGVTNLYTFPADGTMMSTDRDGVTWLGAWEADGEDTIAFTLEAVNADGTGMGQSLRFAIGPNSDEIAFGPDTLQRITPES